MDRDASHAVQVPSTPAPLHRARTDGKRWLVFDKSNRRPHRAQLGHGAAPAPSRLAQRITGDHRSTDGLDRHIDCRRGHATLRLNDGRDTLRPPRRPKAWSSSLSGSSRPNCLQNLTVPPGEAVRADTVFGAGMSPSDRVLHPEEVSALASSERFRGEDGVIVSLRLSSLTCSVCEEDRDTCRSSWTSIDTLDSRADWQPPKA